MRQVNRKGPDANGNVAVNIGVSSINNRTGVVHLPINAFAGCTTAADVASKEVAAVAGFSPLEGAVLAVRFTNSNTAESPRLNYDGIEYVIRDRITAQPIKPGDITAGLYRFMLISGAWILLDKLPSEGTTTPVPGDPGEDGGYWIPAVDEAGNLTWSASKAGMGDAPAAANISGPPGKDGGYYIPKISQSGSNIMQLTFDPSEPGMTSVQARQIVLPKGDPGQDGTSPAVTVATITGGHRLTITDAGGPKSFDVMDGAAGQPGAKGDKGDKGDPGSAAIGLGVCASAADAATKVVSVHTADFAANRSGILTVAFSVGANIADEPSLSINNKLYAIIDCRDGQSAKAAAMAGQAHTYVLDPDLSVAFLINPTDTAVAAEPGAIPVYSCSTEAVAASKILGGAPEIPATQGYTFYVNFTNYNSAENPQLVAGNGTYRIAASGRNQLLDPYNLVAGLHLFAVLNDGWVALLNPHANAAALTAAIEEGLA